MKTFTLLIVMGSCASVGCRPHVGSPGADSAPAASRDSAAAAGHSALGDEGPFVGDPRAGRKPGRPQRPELEE